MDNKNKLNLLELQKKHDEENNIISQAKSIKQERGLKTILGEGIFTVFYETGMEGTLGMCIQDSQYISPNPNFDKNNPDSGPEFYHSMSGLHFLESGDHILVKHENKVIYNGIVTKNKKLMADHNYQFSFLPNEIEFEEFKKWIKNEYKVIFCIERKY